MKLLHKISRHEMLRSWAIAELNSEFFNPADEKDRENILSFLLSGEMLKESTAIKQVLEFKEDLVAALSDELQWHNALLEVSKAEMGLLYTLDGPGWNFNTNGTFLISDAAVNIEANPSLDLRVTGIMNALPTGKVYLDGIVLVADDRSGPYLTIEGNGRLTAIYISELLKQQNVVSKHIKIIIGSYVSKIDGFI